MAGRFSTAERDHRRRVAEETLHILQRGGSLNVLETSKQVAIAMMKMAGWMWAKRWRPPFRAPMCSTRVPHHRAVS